jgi:hypothetical protein
MSVGEQTIEPDRRFEFGRRFLPLLRGHEFLSRTVMPERLAASRFSGELRVRRRDGREKEHRSNEQSGHDP